MCKLITKNWKRIVVFHYIKLLFYRQGLMMKIFGRNVVHGSDSPENGKREIGKISCYA